LPSPSIAFALFDAVAIALFVAVVIALAALPITLFIAHHIIAIAMHILLPLQLLLLPSFTCHPHCHSHCFCCHCLRHCRLIAVSKRWVMTTAAAMAALRATMLGNCGVSSSDDGSCGNSGGKVNGYGGNGIGDNCRCCPRHGPLCHPQRRCL
jgi:hypothetical protein